MRGRRPVRYLSKSGGLELEHYARLLVTRATTPTAAQKKQQSQPADDREARPRGEEGYDTTLGGGCGGVLLDLLRTRPAFHDLLEVLEVLVDHNLRVRYDSGTDLAELTARRIGVVHRDLDTRPVRP